MTATAKRVVFPFDQALPAAQKLWSLSTLILNQVEPARQQAAGVAHQEFVGSYADQFLARMRTSAQSAGNTAHDLQQAAMNIARSWADANHQQQLYAYFAMVKEKRHNVNSGGFLGIGHAVVNFFEGDHTNYGTQPAEPAVPSPPDFAPTPVPQAEVPGESYVIA